MDLNFLTLRRGALALLASSPALRAMARVEDPGGRAGTTVRMAAAWRSDDGERIGGLDPETGAGRHGGKALARLHYRQRAFQAPQVIDLGLVVSRGQGHFCQNFQKGFFSPAT